MSDFRSPIADISFSLRHVADLDSLAKLDGYEHADPELIDGLLEEAGRFFDEVIAPTNRDGDKIGTTLNEDGSVTTAPGFADAYAKLVESGWNGIGLPDPTAAVDSLSCSARQSGDDDGEHGLRPRAALRARAPSRRSCIMGTRPRSLPPSWSPVSGPAR